LGFIPVNLFGNTTDIPYKTAGSTSYIGATDVAFAAVEQPMLSGMPQSRKVASIDEQWYKLLCE
jgi:hypothetical protein